jgi:hypothetical protein
MFPERLPGCLALGRQTATGGVPMQASGMLPTLYHHLLLSSKETIPGRGELNACENEWAFGSCTWRMKVIGSKQPIGPCSGIVSFEEYGN